jgi:hypothetical protein
MTEARYWRNTDGARAVVDTHPHLASITKYRRPALKGDEVHIPFALTTSRRTFGANVDSVARVPLT